MLRLLEWKQNLLGYKEEMEINFVNDISEDNIDVASKITVLGKNVKKYIPSLNNNDIGKFGIISGKLYYIGDDEIGKNAAKSQNIEVIPNGMGTDEFINEMERLAIEESLKQMTGDSFTLTNEDGNSEKVGVELVDKKAGSNWKIIVETSGTDTVATYGTGWTYVSAGSTVDNLGTLNRSYIIDFKNRKMVEFDAKKHTMLAYGSELAVTDGLFFEISPTMIEDKDIKDDIEYGGYAKLEEAFTKSSFKFDGVDDYIEIPYDSSTELKDGFTFQFYGKFLGSGTNYKKSGKQFGTRYTKSFILGTEEELVDKKDDDLMYDIAPSPEYSKSDETYTSELSGIMCAYGPPTCYEVKNNIGWDTFIRFGLLNDEKNGFGFRYNIGPKDRQESYRTEYSQSDYAFNQQIFFEDLGIEDFDYGDEISICVCIDAKNYTQSYYVNGKNVSSGNYSKKCWEDFIEKVTSRIEKYYIGRSSCDNQWHYGEMEIYGLALYNRGLSSPEVMANNNALVAYHNILEKGENAGTSGNTGGEDF